MISMKLKTGNSRGVSLVEVLVAVLMTGFVLASVFGVYVNQHKNWITQEQLTDTQQNARAAIDELTRQIRMAGYELPLGLDGIEAYNTNPDTIVINYSDGTCEVPIEHNMSTVSSDLQCDGHDISCFNDGQWVYIFNPDSGGGEFFQITSVQTGTYRIQHSTMNLSSLYTTGSTILSVVRVKYYIDRSDTTHPNLMMQIQGQSAQVYAEDIEDLQFQYRMKNGTYLEVPSLSSDIRQVSIVLTARTSKADPDFPTDPYRRRAFYSEVNLRNLDI